MILIKRDSLAGKVYTAWVRRDGIPPQQENLCHFMRVIFIWSPLRWFFCDFPDHFVWPSPFLGVISTVGILGILNVIIRIVFLQYIHQHGWLAFLLRVGICIAVGVGALGATLGIIWLVRYKRQPSNESPILLTQYYRAWKQKWCPLVKLDD